MTRNAECGTAIFLILILLAGCAVRPAGEKQERARIDEAGRTFAEQAPPPALPGTPTADDYVEYALRRNAGLQTRFWEWRSAIERIPQVSSYPRLAVGFDTMFSSESITAWNRTTLRAANDSMSNIPFPTKLAAQGRIALENARAAGERFLEAKYLLRQQVLNTYYDLAFLSEEIRIGEESLSLSRMQADQSAARVRSGTAAQTELLNAQTGLDLAQNALANLRAQHAPLAARLNALLGRPAQEPVPLPPLLPGPRPLPLKDDELLQLGAERSPELAALAREVAGRDEALSLAKQAWLPDFSLSAGITGSVSQSVGIMFMLPTQIEAIRAGIAQARADIKRAEAARTQYARDLAASFVLNLVVLRNDERQIELFRNAIVPRAGQAVKIAATEYSNSRITFADMLDAQRALLDARLALAQLRIEREKALAAVETWSAVEVQTSAAPRAGGSGGGGRADSQNAGADSGGSGSGM